MKNIHLIYTDNLSRIGRFIDTDNLFLRTPNDLPRGENVHVYITSDEEISGLENNIWVYNNGRVWLWENTMALISNNKPRKIILTTDQDLDGVQTIDDEFLEWFVKNPSCEYVPIITTIVSNESTYKINIGFESWRKHIIIPQEEPNEEYKYIGECKGNDDNGCFMDSSGHNCGCFSRILKEEPKQETIEEVAERFYSEQSESYENAIEPTFDYSRYLVTGFIDGAKLQAEIMYSEKEVRDLFNLYKEEFSIYRNLQILNVRFEEWFNENKKQQ
jgi:hypothetical protein